MERKVAPGSLRSCSLYDVYTPLVGRRGVAPPPPLSNPQPPPSQIGRGKSLAVSQAALRDLCEQSPIFLLNFKSYSKRNPCTRAASGDKRGVKKVTLFSIPLAGVRTAQVLREKADCSRSCSLRSFYDRNRVSPNRG